MSVYAEAAGHPDLPENANKALIDSFPHMVILKNGYVVCFHSADISSDKKWFTFKAERNEEHSVDMSYISTPSGDKLPLYRPINVRADDISMWIDAPHGS